MADTEVIQEDELTIRKGDASAFSRFVRMLDAGAIDQQASKELLALTDNLERYAYDMGATAKGKLTFVLAIEVKPNGEVKVSPEVKAKTPERKRIPAGCWVTPSGALTMRDPKQQTLPGVVRDIRRNDGAIREV